MLLGSRVAFWQPSRTAGIDDAVWTIISLLASMAGCFGFSALCGQSKQIADTIMGAMLMVEIILRKDIQDYEARPLFGFTYRQVATGAAIAITAAGMGLGISSFTEINTMWLMLIMTVCGAIGLVGLGRIHDLKFEQWFAIWKVDRDWPTVACSPPRRSRRRSCPERCGP